MREVIAEGIKNSKTSEEFKEYLDKCYGVKIMRDGKDYVFPSFGIRFIAIEDRIDTESKDTSAMDMMPIMNVFNEWHSANTSKKIRAVKYSCAQAGKYLASKAPYGYVRNDDKNHTPIIDEEAAQVVRRIFERRAKGESAYRIALDLQADGISSPACRAQVREKGYGRGS